MSSKLVIAGSLGLVLVLAACSPSACGDPSTDGLAAAIGCTAGGGYQRQTETLASTAAERQALAGELSGENARLRGQLGQLEGEERRAASRLMALNNDMAEVDRELQESLRREELTEAEYELAQSELDSLNAQRAAIEPSDPDAEAELAALEEQVAVLRRLID